jgi:hypothetical protein
LARADGQSTDIHPATPYEYWGDYCGYPDIIPNIYEIAGGSLWRGLTAEALMVRVDQIEQRSDDPNFWRFNQTQPNIYSPGTTIPLTGQVPFQNELRFAPNVRSGALVGPDIFATAPHRNDFNPANFVVVFNLAAKKDPVTQACILPDPEHIPASDLYHARATNPLIANTILHYYNIYGAWTGVDYAAFYLDRVPTGHPYLRLRKTGGIAPTDTLALIGHPFGLRTKLQYGIGYAGEETNISYPAFSFPTFNDFYLLEGMSGGPVVNLDKNYIETVVGSPTGSGCLGYYTDSYTNPTYEVMYDLCDDVAEPPGFDTFPPFHEINEGPISTLADLVPTLYLRASPLNDVTYVLPVGGTPSPAQTVYTAVASSNETVNTAVLVGLSPTTMPTNEPGIAIGSYSTSLAPGASTNVTVTANVPASAACGIYDRTVAIIDQTHGFRDVMHHRFELGMTDFTIASAQPLDLYAIAAPSMPAQITFTLTNTRPSATTVAVSANQTWASLSSASVSLAAAGQPGASATVSVSLATAAFSLTTGDYPITLSFADQSGCAITPTRTQTVLFHKGKLVLTQAFADPFVPMPTPPGSPTQSYVDVPETFCISDMSVRLDTITSGDNAGDHLAVWAPHLGLSLDYVHGTTSYSSPLWANSALPAGWTVPTSYDPALFADIETLLLDRYANSPPNGVNWSPYVGKNAPAGRWTLKITDDGVGSTGRNGTIAPQWILEIHGSAATCRLNL